MTLLDGRRTQRRNSPSYPQVLGNKDDKEKTGSRASAKTQVGLWLSALEISAMVTTSASLCPICLEENPTDLLTLACKHQVCRPCFLRLIFVPSAFTKCPMCRSVISLAKLFKSHKRLSWITVYDQFKAKGL